jgi:hypothetical protein
MIDTRILDNDMGAVLKLPLTGRGTIHGITISIDEVKLPEFDVGLLEMIAPDKGITRFTAHTEAHVSSIEDRAKFIDHYKKWMK